MPPQEPTQEPVVKVPELPPSSATPPLSGNALNRQKHSQLFAHGNYHNYYFHRTPQIPDARLSLLPPSLFTSKRVLDLGCNAGKLTMECMSHLGAKGARGIDLDPYLIADAQRLMEEAKVEGCEFAEVDFMKEGYFEGRKEAGEEYDVIFLLSITKWLHLHHGDAGLLRLFQSLFDFLPSSGTLVVEPQEWENYKKAVGKNKLLRPVFRSLEMRPDFEEELTGVGFRLVEKIEREEGGFSRPLMVWRKD